MVQEETMPRIDMADVKPTITSLVVVGLMSIVFISFAKWALQRWRVPGLTELILSV